ncbi:hypothetical protein C8R43DRAFT_967987 [Mycena crocata]|nr:hypothetical protein C8R43DRAFT_967987 [Mycena crocata]
MPWHSESDGFPDQCLCHFGLGLNEVLDSMRPDCVANYAFSGKMAQFILATSVQGKDGVYHNVTPHTEFEAKVEWKSHPTVQPPRKGEILGFILECDLQLKEVNEKGCEMFENGLARIRSADEAAVYGYWYHDRRRDGYSRVLPDVSTYVFQRPLGIKRVFRVCWNTSSYPPRPVTNFTYTDKSFFHFEMTIPLILPLLDDPCATGDLSAVLKKALATNTSKGKGRA